MSFKDIVSNRIVIALIGLAVGQVCPPAVPVIQAILVTVGS